MKLATFNINSVRAREKRLVAFLRRQAPDVVCLQELKCLETEFPWTDVRAAGYEGALLGQKTYNGVAILAKTPLAEVEYGLGDAELDAQARVVSATVGGVRVTSAYFPNGGELGSEKWAFKLRFLAALAPYVRRQLEGHATYVLAGDFNVAPFDDDVARPKEWADTVLCHADARAGLARIAEQGLVDLFRPFHPDGGVYTWWDYRAMGFERDNGLRIDHFYGSVAAAARTIGAGVDRRERAGEQASDHAPVMVELA